MDSSAVRKGKATQSNLVSGALILALLLGAIWMGVDEVRNSTPVQGPAPGFSFERFGGGQVTSAELRGKIVMLDFWGTWCGPCKEEMPWLVSVGKEYQSKGVEFVAVNDSEDERSNLEHFLASMPALEPFAVFGERTAMAQYKVHAFPTLVIIDRKGNILTSQTGQTTERTVRRLLDEALATK